MGTCLHYKKKSDFLTSIVGNKMLITSSLDICVQNIIDKYAQKMLENHNIFNISNPVQYFNLSFICNKLPEHFGNYDEFAELVMGIMQDTIIIKTELNIDDISRIDYDHVVAEDLYYSFDLYECLDEKRFYKLDTNGQINLTIVTLNICGEEDYPNRLIPTNTGVIEIH